MILLGGWIGHQLNQTMRVCKEELIKFYKHEMSRVQLLPWYDDFRDMDDIYVNLELKEQRFAGRSKLEKNEDLVTLKARQGMPATRVLVKGVVGSGKSTLLARLAYRWAQQSSNSPLIKFDLVFILRLREVERDSSLIDAIYQQLLAPDTNVSRSDIQAYIESHPNKILILFDDYNDYKGKNRTSDRGINKILSFKMLQNCTVILSTCPYEHLGVHQSHYISVKLRGFSLENVNAYITKFFYRDTDMVEGFSRRLHESEMLTSLSTIPVMLMLMCLLWGDNQKLPDTQSELYQQFALYLWRKYCIRQAVDVDIEGDYGRENSTNFILGLGRVALAGLCPKENINWEKIVFSENDFDELHKGCAAGLLTKERLRSKLNITSAVTFLHKSFQQFCAANYWASLLEANPDEFYAILMQINTWNTFVSKIELLKFCCGLVHNIGAVAIIHHGLSVFKRVLSYASPVTVGFDIKNMKSKQDISHILILLFESHMSLNNHSSSDIFKMQSAFDRFCKKNTSFQQLTDVNLFSQSLESLFTGCELKVYDRPPQTLSMLHYFVKSSFGLSSLRAVKSVMFNEIPEDSWDVVNDTLECMPQVQKVDIDISCLNYLQPVHLRQFCLKLTRLIRLNEIQLGSYESLLAARGGSINTKLTPKIVASILDAIQSRINKMSLHHIYIGEAIGHISHIMTPCLLLLDLGNARLKEDHIKVLSDFLPKASNLQALVLHNNTVGMAAVPLTQQLQYCTKLENLDLSNTHLTEQGVIELAQRFVFLPNLCWLDIYGNDVENAGTHAVFKNLLHLAKLDKFCFTAYVDNQCSVLVKECVTAIGMRISDTGFLNIDRHNAIPFRSDGIELIRKIGVKHQ